MEAVCTLLGEKETWESSKKLLGKSDFLEMLTTYDKDNISASILKKLRKNYIPLEEMQPEIVQKVWFGSELVSYFKIFKFAFVDI